MDCLDRSTISQAMLGHKMLVTQLYSLLPDIREATMFQQMWVRKLYAGTGALSQGGSKILDGVRSAARTIQINVLDGDMHCRKLLMFFFWEELNRMTLQIELNLFYLSTCFMVGRHRIT